MPSLGNINLKVVLFETDFYALQSLNSYLAWDRRTRVMFYTESLDALWTYLHKTALAELPDVVILDVDHIGGQNALISTVDRMMSLIDDVRVIGLTQQIEPQMLAAAANTRGVVAYLSKNEVRLQIAHAVVYTLNHDFVVTKSVARTASKISNNRLFHAAVLPERREYPELTQRIRQAIQLCVVEGMPANLAADEMGISLHTIRSYIKEGYRILESYDDTEYPADMTPQERAFMRFTALADEKDTDDKDSPPPDPKQEEA